LPITGKFNGTGVACGFAGVPERARLETLNVDAAANAKAQKDAVFVVDRLMVYPLESKETVYPLTKSVSESSLLKQ